MAKRYTVIPTNTFDALQMDAGILLRNFDIEAAASGGKGFDVDKDVICATTGGITVNCTPTFSDFGQDVDNVAADMLELKHLDKWECKISTTSISTDAEGIRLALGCADVSADGKAVIPRSSLKVSDAEDIWWVGDKANNGFVAVRLMKALSTGGLSLKTSKNGKGQTQFELTGHVSLEDQETVPMLLYSMDPAEVVSYNVTQNLTHVISSYVSPTVSAGGPLVATLTADSGYAINNVSVVMDGRNVTQLYYSDGEVNIPESTGDITITASAAAVSTTYSVTQALTNVTSSFTGNSIAAGGALTATLTADSGYTISSVTVTMGSADITGTAYDSSTNSVSVSSVSGDITITATATN